MSPTRPGEVGGVPGADAKAAPAVGNSHRARATLGGLLLFLGLAGLGYVLDGATGVVVAVGVFAVILAGLQPRLIAMAGVLALVFAPVSVLLRGVPEAGEVSPAFVTGSLWPHHLVFAGLALVGSYAVIDVVQHRRTGQGALEPAPETVEPLGRTSLPARVVLFGVTVVAAAIAVVAVFTQ